MAEKQSETETETKKLRDIHRETEKEKIVTAKIK